MMGFSPNPMVFFNKMEDVFWRFWGGEKLLFRHIFQIEEMTWAVTVTKTHGPWHSRELYRSFLIGILFNGSLQSPIKLGRMSKKKRGFFDAGNAWVLIHTFMRTPGFLCFTRRWSFLNPLHWNMSKPSPPQKKKTNGTTRGRVNHFGTLFVFWNPLVF